MSRRVVVWSVLALAVALAILVTFALLLASLFDGDDSSSAEELGQTPATEAGDELADTAAPASGDQSVPDPSTRKRGRIVTWDFAYADEDTGTVNVTFGGGKAGEIETDPCVAEYELEVLDRSSHFEITVYELEPENTDMWPDSYSCDLVGYFRELTEEIATPLNGREGFGGYSDLVSLQDLLVPTALPEGWEWLYTTGGAPEVLFAYGPLEALDQAPRDRAPFSLRISPVHSGVPMLDEVRNLAGSEQVDLERRTAWVATRPNSRVLLAFENDHWSYQITGGVGVERELVEAFARSFVVSDGATFTAGLIAPRLNEGQQTESGEAFLELFSSTGQDISPLGELAGDARNVRANVAWETALTAGRRITVTFEGGAPGNFESVCNWDYRITADESPESVSLRLRSLRVLTAEADIGECGGTDTPWALTTTLAEPLGDRELVDATTGLSWESVQIETRLVPTWLPVGWVTTVQDKTLPRQMSTYVSTASEPAKIVLLTTPISVTPRLSDLRRLPGRDHITVRRDGDGIVHTDIGGSMTVAFEEQGWYYRLIAEPDIDPAVVLEIARSFERPALIAPGTLPASLTQPQTTIPPQAGQ